MLLLLILLLLLLLLIIIIIIIIIITYSLRFRFRPVPTSEPPLLQPANIVRLALIHNRTLLVLLLLFVAAVLHLHCMVHVMLFPMLNASYSYTSTFRSTRAVPSVAVLCSSLMLCFPAVPQAFSKLFLKGSSCPYYYGQHFRFHIHHTLYFSYKVFIFQNYFLILSRSHC